VEVFLVGYGTLLHRGSLGHSIGRETAEGKRALPVVVRGYRRLFNLRPDHYATSFKLSREPIENAAMNVEPAFGKSFNGVAFEVTPEELHALDRRERYYQRRAAPVYHFHSGEHLGDGHFYVSEPDASWIVRDVEKLMPLWRDVVWARTGAYRLGEAFGRCYDQTTYLADGRTLVIDRYRDVIEEVSDVELPE
jgi:cation transport regulator ChaC